MTELANMWTRSQPVHPEARDVLARKLPYELVDLILAFAARPEPLALHMGAWCTPSAPCPWCRGLMRERRDSF